jgi:hypothetical protein
MVGRSGEVEGMMVRWMVAVGDSVKQKPDELPESLHPQCLELLVLTDAHLAT